MGDLQAGDVFSHEAGEWEEVVVEALDEGVAVSTEHQASMVHLGRCVGSCALLEM